MSTTAKPYAQSTSLGLGITRGLCGKVTEMSEAGVERF